MHTGLWWGDFKESERLGDLGVDGRMMIKIDVEQDGTAWTGLTF